MNEDKKHLELLAIFHYIVGGIMFLFSCMPIIHLVIGLSMIFAPELWSRMDDPPPVFAGYMFAIAGGLFFILGIAFSSCVLYSGFLIKKYKKRMFSFVIAYIECIFVPFGTVLGVFTIVVLSRDSVKELYGIGIKNKQ